MWNSWATTALPWNVPQNLDGHQKSRHGKACRTAPEGSRGGSRGTGRTPSCSEHKEHIIIIDGRGLRAEWSRLLEWQISGEMAQQAAQVGSTGYNQPHVNGRTGLQRQTTERVQRACSWLSDHELAARVFSLVDACELLAATPACTRPAWRSTRATRSRCTTSHHLLLPV